MRGDEAVPDRDGIDERIDRALRSYAEPAEFPEARVVLARVMERARASESQRRGWWVWGAALAAGLAVVVLVGLVWMMRGPRRVEIAGVPKAPGLEENFPQRLKPGSYRGVYGTAEAVPLQNRTQRVHAVLPGNGIAEQDHPLETLPKKEMFPAQRPLSAEEQALMVFANDVPAKVQQQVIEAQLHAGDPIVIAELNIAPLEIGEGTQGSNEQEKDKEK